MIVDRKLEDKDLADFGENIVKICQNSASYLLKKQHLLGENQNR